jgi:transcriptional regulator with XRE-family HTH domain
MPATPKRQGRQAEDGARFPDDVAADNVRAYRVLRRLSQEDIAARMRALGHGKWSQAAVSQVENHGRTVTIGELFNLALVLDVTVADLLDPLGPDIGTDVDYGGPGVVTAKDAHGMVRDEWSLGLEWDGDTPRRESLTKNSHGRRNERKVLR